ncbi:ferritin-like domain-containing protein [Hymenobacter convexus]|uniref:ferritin-like domain-containing protein n=1 Tax=Hymenobacter sp. CA1UV-4 TaxID=3063782 RepID=UPI0027136AAB|nr:ferritin-like domain-containing protein [Hymenobacter sp. CA1UV-4]MDO7851006.1 ferritin-like domain-containing protein [Hymenobacter sp. CA1UV-4]
MDLFQLIDDIAQADPEVYARFDSRRATFRHFLGFGRKFSAAALPVVLSTLFTKVYGQTTTLPQAVKDVLNLALQLEYLEFYFYDTALNSPALMLSSDENKSLTTIRNDEQLHINTLRTALGTAASTLTRNNFDYTGSQGQTRAALFAGLGAPTTGLFTDRTAFFTVAQLLEDTGVRAYKGAVPSLNIGTTQDAVKDLLEVALNIHSVEARHAARIRSLRRGGVQSITAPKSWITPDETTNALALPNNAVPNTPATVSPYLAGSPAATFPAESNVLQGPAARNVQTLTTGVSGTAGAEAFDEPLDAPTAKAIAKNFVTTPSLFFN